MIRFQNWLESQNKMIGYIQSLVPNWPLYVISDLLHKNFSPSLNKPTNDPKELRDFLQEFAQEFGYDDPRQMEWKLENVKVVKDIFDDETLRRMQTI
jgi:uncharacterized protein (DUF2267 family)